MKARMERIKKRIAREYRFDDDLILGDLMWTIGVIEGLQKDAEPFQAQIVQRKTYKEVDHPRAYTVSDYPSSGDIKQSSGGER
jgi:hypothetical protein